MRRPDSVITRVETIEYPNLLSILKSSATLKSNKVLLVAQPRYITEAGQNQLKHGCGQQICQKILKKFKCVFLGMSCEDNSKQFVLKKIFHPDRNRKVVLTEC